jgi:hypothetical protein
MTLVVKNIPVFFILLRIDRYIISLQPSYASPTKKCSFMLILMDFARTELLASEYFLIVLGQKWLFDST